MLPRTSRVTSSSSTAGGLREGSVPRTSRRFAIGRRSMAKVAHFQLTGKKAMVVGVENPAAAAIARAYAEAGADVALCTLEPDATVVAARKLARQIESMGRKAGVYVMDVKLGKNVQVTTRQIAKELGGLDVVCSAPDHFFAK